MKDHFFETEADSVNASLIGHGNQTSNTIAEIMLANANTERARGRMAQANDLYKRILDLSIKPNFKPFKIITMQELAFSYLLDGNFSASSICEYRLLQLLKEANRSANSKEQERSLNQQIEALARLSTLYILRDSTKEAITSLNELLALMKQVNSPNIVACLNTLAPIYQSSGNYKQAEELYRRSLELQEGNAKVTQDYIDCLKGLGKSLCAQGKEKQGKLFCRVAHAEGIKNKSTKPLRTEFSDTAHSLCRDSKIEYVKPICDEVQKLALVEEPESLIGKLNTYTRIVKHLIPHFERDSVDLRIEQILMSI